MKIWIKHILGLCKKPDGFAFKIAKVRQAEPGSILYMSKEELHWSIKHRDWANALIGEGRGVK